MSMNVRTNVNALNAHRNLKNTGINQSRAAGRLASGFRINSAADDAAGLAISETMRDYNSPKQRGLYLQIPEACRKPT